MIIVIIAILLAAVIGVIIWFAIASTEKFSIGKRNFSKRKESYKEGLGGGLVGGGMGHYVPRGGEQYIAPSPNQENYRENYREGLGGDLVGGGNGYKEYYIEDYRENLKNNADELKKKTNDMMKPKLAQAKIALRVCNSRAGPLQSNNDIERNPGCGECVDIYEYTPETTS